MLKALLWLGSSRDDVRDFPPDARSRAGYELYLVQTGLYPSDWKPMSSVGAGVREIRVRSGREHRILYVAKFEEGIYVLHAFEKKTQRTSKADLERARQRLRKILKNRRGGNRSSGAGL
jgi:phage-related protein